MFLRLIQVFGLIQVYTEGTSTIYMVYAYFILFIKSFS